MGPGSSETVAGLFYLQYITLLLMGQDSALHTCIHSQDNQFVLAYRPDKVFITGTRKTKQHSQEVAQ